MARKERKKIGELLVEAGVTKPEQVEQAVATAKNSRKRTGEVLVEMQACSEEDVARALGRQFGMEFVNLDRPEGANRINRKLLTEDIIKKFLILPLDEKSGNSMKILVHDPMDLDALSSLQFRLSCTFVTLIAARGQIRRFVEGEREAPSLLNRKSVITASVNVTTDKTRDSSRDSSQDKSVDRSTASLDGDGKDATKQASAAEVGAATKVVDRLIIDAVQHRASDIHIEPLKDAVRVRYRIDGSCLEVERIDKKLQSSILAKIKLMAGVNIAERRVPQDGRIKFVVDGSAIDFRVSACPAYWGESIVLRILRPESARIGLLNLGLQQDTLDTFNKIIRRPNGIFLVTGPTGSGKTTTLYSALNDLNRPDRKIITAEDPVEFSFEGINQVQVREKIGLTFPVILKSMLRQAPNIILVGEIRDREVADIAIQAALTGHLVFSTLHTNDAPSAITRLIDMGVKPFLVASSIQAVLAQRLARILCPECKVRDDSPDPHWMRIAGITAAEIANGNIMKGVGCAKCDNVGYRGRRGVYEMMVMNAEIRDLAFQRSTVSKLRGAAVRSGMRTLLGDGKIKVLNGMTTAQEVATFAQAEISV
ncbi:MAG: type II/IV secretion system protein [Phycisphaerales bacterium]|nr:type II/IV secretion system protein [Phycisphaerales bacterium]